MPRHPCRLPWKQGKQGYFYNFDRFPPNLQPPTSRVSSVNLQSAFDSAVATIRDLAGAGQAAVEAMKKVGSSIYPYPPFHMRGDAKGKHRASLGFKLPVKLPPSPTH